MVIPVVSCVVKGLNFVSQTPAKVWKKKPAELEKNKRSKGSRRMSEEREATNYKTTKQRKEGSNGRTR
jgi:hypothetical protein